MAPPPGKPDKGDLSLPPPIQMLENQIASKRQEAKVKKEEKDGAKQKDTLKTPIKKNPKPKAESTPSASDKDDSHSDSDEDGLDAVIAELEKSIKTETMQNLGSSKQRMTVKEKREKAARLH